MDWSAMFSAPVVVLGCGNTLFGDDGIGPRAVAELADECHPDSGAVFLDAGTSVRTLLADLLLSGASPRRLIVVDAVMEPDREPGSILEWPLRDSSDPGKRPASLHQAPTPMLLEAVRSRLGCEVRVLTVQAARIPEEMDETMSPEALAALPELKAAIRRLCSASRSDA
ncbi:hydrogenase maturation protease [Fundidesulfovibrio putealis]|uniref:hydrogenase maturation protease n=1 Tax=Fundidesulfovibrio putealis TaxID=270496 RepID=UPI0004190DC4|nr:hydrogenase maturation protease [Fundidesulfovibrio putealis]